MKSFPMFVRMSGREVIIIGGAEQAAQKTRLMLKTEAKIVVFAATLEPELEALAIAGEITHQTGAPSRQSLRDAALVFVASGNAEADKAAHGRAKSAGALVNVVDQPALCDVTTPSIVDRDPVVIAIGTEGNAPVLGRALKTQIEEMLDIRLGGYAALAGRLRTALAASMPADQRRQFWQWAFHGAPWQAHKRGAERAAAKMLKAAIAAGQVPGAAGDGALCVIGAGPGPRDLLPLRAVERLQNADVIYCDRAVSADMLELARRDAKRVFLKGSDWPAARTGEMIMAQARKGLRVVWLVPGAGSCPANLGPDAVEFIPGIAEQTAASQPILASKVS
ncbi:MAG: siroheme synthase [Rhodobacteraceae bacterium]|nr:siroheme synthase [Paracoccaceae bacterium]